MNAAQSQNINILTNNRKKTPSAIFVPSPATVAKIAAYRNMGKKALRKKLQELEVKMWDN